MSIIEKILILNPKASMQYVRKLIGIEKGGFVLDANETKLVIPRNCVLDKFSMIPRIQGKILEKQTGTTVCYVKNMLNGF